MAEYLYAFAALANRDGLNYFTDGFIIARSRQEAIRKSSEWVKTTAFPAIEGFGRYICKVIKVPKAKINRQLYSVIVSATDQYKKVCFKVTWTHARSKEEAIGQGTLRAKGSLFPVEEGFTDHACDSFRLPIGMFNQFTNV